MTQQVEGKRDLVLAPGEYAYLQDETRGMVKTFAVVGAELLGWS